MIWQTNNHLTNTYICVECERTQYGFGKKKHIHTHITLSSRTERTVKALKLITSFSSEIPFITLDGSDSALNLEDEYKWHHQQ